MNIAILDDEPKMIELLKQYICTSSFYQPQMNIFKYQSTHDIINTNHDIYFLDIDLPSQNNGISIAQHIKQNNSQAIIIFYTNKENRMHETFAIQPFYFLRKNFLSDDFKILDILLLKKLKDMNKSITLLINGRNTTLYFYQIQYIEAMDHHLYIHTLNNNYIIYSKLSSILEQLPDSFIQIHRSYIINYDHLLSYQHNQLKLKNDIELPIGRKYKQNFINQYKRYLLQWTSLLTY